MMTGGDVSYKNQGMTSVEILNRDLNSWIEQDIGLPLPVHRHALAIYQDIVLSVGGSTLDSDIGFPTTLNDIWRYDENLKLWIDIGMRMEKAREEHIAVITDAFVECN